MLEAEGMEGKVGPTLSTVACGVGTGPLDGREPFEVKGVGLALGFCSSGDGGQDLTCEISTLPLSYSLQMSAFLIFPSLHSYFSPFFRSLLFLFLNSYLNYSLVEITCVEGVRVMF